VLTGTRDQAVSVVEESGMNCKPSDVPPIEEIDISAMRRKYQEERDKRLRPEGQAQYVQPAGKFVEAYESDPHMPVTPRDPIVMELDVAVIGAGFCGLLTSIQLKQAGIENFRNIDWAGDWGGCWYWNRYPGVQCDNDSYCYMPLLEETGYMPKKKFEDGWDIYQHCVRIAKHYDLYRHAIFHTLVLALKWDEAIKRWRITTNRGDDIRARFVVMAGGPLNKPKLPGIPGLSEFEGKIFHTARWEYAYTGGNVQAPVLDKLADKKVAIIGTGATAVQAIPYLGKYARQLYVIQRTPSSVDERNNPPTAPQWVKSLAPGWQKERQINFHHGVMDTFARGEPDIVCDIWTEVNRNISAELDKRGWPQLTPREFGLLRRNQDYQVMERLRRRVDSIVQDKQTAEGLKPYYRFLCKRPCSNDDFYPTFNRPNVKLIDVSSTQGVERLTPKGFVHNGVEYEVDCIILASGFEMTSELRKRWGIDVIEGRNDVSIYDHWEDGYKTLHGTMTHGFPNQFFTGFTQTGVNATNSVTMVSQGRHIGYIIGEVIKRGIHTVEPHEDAQNAWITKVRSTAIDVSAFARDCTPGYYNNEGEAKLRWYLGEPYGPGYYAFEELLEDWRGSGNLEGLVLGYDNRLE
jgi:cation diffusion facilitator CzcD-associated flavoprotein CzcO